MKIFPLIYFVVIPYFPMLSTYWATVHCVVYWRATDLKMGGVSNNPELESMQVMGKHLTLFGDLEIVYY